MRREGSPWQGLGVVVLKELSDHLASARMRVLEWLVVLTALTAVYGAIQQIREVTAEDPFLFLRLFTTAREPLPSFVSFLGFLVPLMAIGLGFDAVDAPSSRGSVALGVSETLSLRLGDWFVSVSASLAKVLPPVLSRAKALMDLACHPAEVARALGALAQAHPGLRVPGAFDGFEVAVRAILGQLISVAAARTLAGRFAAAFGDPLATPFDGLRTVFPTAERIADASPAQVAKLGMPSARARSVIALARAVAGGHLELVPNADIEATLEALRALPGVGEWTAQYIAMRALAWPDAFPHTDLGVMRALGESNPKRVLAAGEAWRPWRAYAVMHLWHSPRKE